MGRVREPHQSFPKAKWWGSPDSTHPTDRPPHTDVQGTSHGVPKVNSVLELIGDTPLVRINRMNPVAGVELLAKLECMNPGGSVKDRIGLRMIEQAEAAGELTPGKIVLEASSGNTAIGLAMVCAVKGYQLLVTMSESASEERKRILRAYGAQILLTPGYRGTDGAIEEAYRLAREEPGKYVLVDQFNNDANWQAHYDGTGKEIWEATGGKVNVVVITMGTTGTLMGVTRALRELNPAVRVVGVEPYKGHKIQGLKNMKESYAPGIFKPDELAAIVNVDDDSAYEAARRLAREEGIFVGMSAGAAMKVAIDEAQALGQGTVVALLPDGGERYLSTSLFVSETVPEPLRFYNTLSRQGGAARARLAGQGDHLLLRAEPGRAARLGALPPGGLRRRAAALPRMPRLPGQTRHEPRRHRRPHRPASASRRARSSRSSPPAGRRSSSRRWTRCASSGRTTIPGPASTSADMVEQTRGLLEKGLAYEKLRSIYFRISSYAGYGKLSRDRAAAGAERGVDDLRLLRQGQSRRLRPVQAPDAGRAEGRHLLADPLGQRPARLARRMRLHGRSLPRPADRHPHGQHGPDLPSRRQRDRHRLRAEGQAAGQALDALRSGHGRRKESEPRRRQRPHARTPDGNRGSTGRRSATGCWPRTTAPCCTTRPASSAGRPIGGAAQRVRRAARAIAVRAGAAPTSIRRSTRPAPAGRTPWTTTSICPRPWGGCSSSSAT